MDGLTEASSSSRAWVFSYSIDVFSDSFYIGSALHEVFKDINNIQWIAVLDSAHGHAAPCWDVWVCFSTPVQCIEIDRLMSGMTSGASTDAFMESTLIPIEIVCRCIEGCPYVQHNIPVDWKEIAMNTPATIIV